MLNYLFFITNLACVAFIYLLNNSVRISAYIYIYIYNINLAYLGFVFKMILISESIANKHFIFLSNLNFFI